MPLKKKRVVRRRAPARRPMMGGRKLLAGRGFMDWVNKAKDFVKSNQLLSKGASALGYNDVAGTLRNYGYGRRRMTGGRIMFPAVYTAGLGGMSATTY